MFIDNVVFDKKRGYIWYFLSALLKIASKNINQLSFAL